MFVTFYCFGIYLAVFETNKILLTYLFSVATHTAEMLNDLTSDINQLRIIMNVTGTPSVELLERITNCQVRLYCRVYSILMHSLPHYRALALAVFAYSLVACRQMI